MYSPKLREHPVVDKTFVKKRAAESTKQFSYVCVRSFIITMLLYFDLQYEFSATFFELNGLWYWTMEFFIVCLSTFNFTVNMAKYIATLSSGVVEMTEAQKKLLGVQKGESGFKTAQPVVNQPAAPIIDSIISPSTFCASPPPTGSLNTSSTLFAKSPILSSANASSSSLLRTNGFQQQSSLLNASSSAYLNSSSANASYNLSAAGQNSFSTPEPASNSATAAAAASPYQLDASGVRHRLQNTSTRRSPMYAADDDCIKDMKEFSQFLKEHDDSHCDVTASHDASGIAGQSSFWSFNRSISDLSPMLRKYTYQIACRSPASSKKTRDDHDDAVDSYMAEEFWAKAGY